MNDTLRPALSALRRRVYLIGLPLGAATCILVWFIERAEGVLHVFDRYGLPLLAFFLAGLALLIVRRGLPLARLERALFVGFAAFMVGSLSFTLYTPSPPGVEVGDLAGAGYWFPVVYCLAFLMFGERTGRRLALALFAVSLLMGVVHVLIEPAALRAEGLILSQLYVANGLVLLLVSSFAHLARLQTEQSLTLERIANTDPLTRLGNRRRLEVQVTLEIARAARYRSPFAVILFDLDHFKRVNDRHGHGVGDAVLRETGRLLEAELREADQIGRWGGEEFLILAPELDVDAATRQAERLRRVLENHSFPRVGHITGSFGVAGYTPGDTLASLIHRADEALYTAKREGRNLVRVA